MASELGWRLEVREARGSIAQELGEIVGQARLPEWAERCYVAKLSRVGAMLNAASASGRLLPVADIGHPLFQSWSDGVWQSTLAAQTASHFDRSDLDDLAGLYEIVRLLGQLNREELGYWSDLSALVGPGQAVAPDELDRLHAALSDARTRSNLIALLSVRVQQIVQAYRLPCDGADAPNYGNTPLAQVRTCRPPRATPVPAAYGAGALDGASDAARASPIVDAD